MSAALSCAVQGPDWPMVHEMPFFAGLTLATVVIPMGHITALALHVFWKNDFSEAVRYPLSGGLRSSCYQLAGLAMWIVSLLCTVLPAAAEARLAHTPLPSNSVHTIAAVAGLLGALFLLKAHLVHVHMRSVYLHLRYTAAASLVAAGCGLLLCGTAAALLHVLERVPNRGARVVNVVLALVCLVIAMTSSHGLSGYLYHCMGAASAGRRSWRFYQPFQGGKPFMATQGLGWTVFAVVMLGLLHLLYRAACGLSHMSSWPLVAGAMLAQVAIAASVHVFAVPAQKKRRAADAVPRVSGTSAAPVLDRESVLSEARPSLLAMFHRAMPLGCLFLPAHLWALALGIVLSSFPLAKAVSLLVIVHTPYFLLTNRGRPAVTGCRKSSAFVAYSRQHLGAAFTWWMTRCEVIKAFPEALNPAKRYIFTYSPHGLMPAGAAYLAQLPSWRSLFPGIHPVTLTADVMHCVPVLRDFCAWAGLRQVSRATFQSTLHSERHVLLCPGGQAELVYAGDAHGTAHPVVRLCVRHKGFCRIALAHGAALVPILSFGELLQFTNAVRWRWMQGKTYRALGFPLPFLLAGHWWTPLPKRIPAIFAVGAPIEAGAPLDSADITHAAVDDLHRRYYEGVVKLWSDCKDKHPEYSNIVLQFDGDIGVRLPA